MKLEINETTLKFQKNIWINTISSTLKSTGLNVKKLNGRLLNKVKLEMYNMIQTFSLESAHIIPFMMLLGEYEYDIVVNGQTVKVKAGYYPSIQMIYFRINWGGTYNGEEILIKIEAIDDEIVFIIE